MAIFGEVIKQDKKLNDMLIALSQFFSRSSHHKLPFYKLLRKEETFEWEPEYETIFTKLEEVLSHPLVLIQPNDSEPCLSILK